MSEVSVPAAFTSALQQLHEWLESEGVAYVAIGGIAVSLLAQPRGTQAMRPHNVLSSRTEVERSGD